MKCKIWVNEYVNEQEDELPFNTAFDLLDLKDEDVILDETKMKVNLKK